MRRVDVGVVAWIVFNGGDLQGGIHQVAQLIQINGLLHKIESAPVFRALIAMSMLPNAVMTATGTSGSSRAMCSTSSRPLPSGNCISVRHRSKALLAAAAVVGSGEICGGFGFYPHAAKRNLQQLTDIRFIVNDQGALAVFMLR